MANLATTVQDPPGPLRVERLHDGRRKLLRALVVDVSGETFTVPEGFPTDFSSIPWFGRWVIDWAKADVAGVVHDYLYSDDHLDFPRWRADVVWFRIVRAGHRRANVVQAAACYAALVLFGWIFKRTGPGCSRRHKIVWAASESVAALAIAGVLVWSWFER